MTFKPDIPGNSNLQLVTIYNLGNSNVSIGVLAGKLPFVGANNKVNFNSLSVGIIVLIGAIVLILDGWRISPNVQTTLPSSSAITNTETETIVLDSWIDRFAAWLIDFIIGSIGLGMLFAAISLLFWIAFPQMFESTNMNMPFSSLDRHWSSYIISSFVFVVFWTYFESTTG
jgi:hypothetical protein